MKIWTERHEIFCERYAATGNIVQSVKDAGFSHRGASACGSRLLANERIKERVAKHRQARCERTGIDADYVLNQLAGFQQALISEIIEDDGTLKPIGNWPEHWQRMVEGIDVDEIWEGSGEDRVMVGHTKKIRLMNRSKTMEMMGRHVDVGAFADRKIIEDKRSFAELLSERKTHAESVTKH